MKIELGKKYRCRDGKVVGPMEKSGNVGIYAAYEFRCPLTQYTYTPSGVYHTEQTPDDIDIVSEYVPESEVYRCPECERVDEEYDPTRQTIERIGTAVVQTLLKKNKDYGSSVFESPVLFPALKAKDCILIRMSDKIKRFSNLVGQEDKAEVDETIADTMQDLAGYAILWLVAKELEHATDE